MPERAEFLEQPVGVLVDALARTIDRIDVLVLVVDGVYPGGLADRTEP